MSEETPKFEKTEEIIGIDLGTHLVVVEYGEKKQKYVQMKMDYVFHLQLFVLEIMKH